MITLLLLVRATNICGVALHAHPVRGESHNQHNTTGEVATVSTHTVTPTKQSAAESTRNKIYAIKRIELPRDFRIHLSESIVAIPY